MIVMVMVTPGSAPPTTPTSVPRNSGSRYFHCRMLTMPCRAARAWLTNPSRRRAAAAPAGSARTRGRSPPTVPTAIASQHRPLARRARRLERSLQGGDEQRRGDAEPEQRQQRDVDADDGEGEQHQADSCARRLRRRLGRGWRARRCARMSCSTSSALASRREGPARCADRSPGRSARSAASAGRTLNGSRTRLTARPISPAIPSRDRIASFLDQAEVGHDGLVLAVDLVEEGRVALAFEVGDARCPAASSPRRSRLLGRPCAQASSSLARTGAGVPFGTIRPRTTS